MPNYGVATPEREHVKLQGGRMGVGLAENPRGVHFQCGTCAYFDNGVCHNSHPRLDGKKVKAEWCCNLFDHKGMKVIVRG